MISSSPRPLIALLLVTLVGGCAPIPQTSTEFRTQMAAHRRGRVEQWTVRDRPAAVIDRLERAMRTCIDRQETTCYQGCTTQIHHHSVESDGNTTTFVVQSQSGGRNSRREPPGGSIEMVLDVTSQDRGTELTWTGGDHMLFASQFEALRRWSERIEHPIDCPEIPTGFGAIARDPNAGPAPAR